MRGDLKLLILFILAYTAISQTECPATFNCSACTDGCDNCTTDLAKCDNCSTGFYLNSSSMCVGCPTKCLVCSINTQCTKCTPGYDREYDAEGNQICVFYWWKWFLIVFGTLLGVVLVGFLFWWVRNKLKEEDGGREVQYEMKAKMETTESNIKG